VPYAEQVQIAGMGIQLLGGSIVVENRHVFRCDGK